jgi:molybdate transport system substrate-binding protein
VVSLLTCIGRNLVGQSKKRTALPRCARRPAAARRAPCPVRLRALPPLAVIALSACEPAPPREAATSLVWAAAADLAAAAPELAAAFERETGIRVEITIGSSGQLAQQILNGAPIDVFASADSGWVQQLTDAGKTVPGTESVYARGHLVVFTLSDSLAISRIEDLAAPGVRRIAIANPEHAPYGRAAREALQSGGLWELLHARIVIGDNVRHTVQLAQSRNVDVAVTSRALMQDGTGRWATLPESLHSPLTQVAAVVSGRPREADAQRFLDFLLGAEGRRILSQFDFALPAAAESL